MKTLEIVLGKSIGDINFGMERNYARQFLGDYREFPSGSDNVNSYDAFSFCHLGYDKHNKVEFICIHSFDDLELSFNGKIISNMTALELYSFIFNLDSNVDIEDGGISFTNNVLGFAAYFEKTPAVLLTTSKEIICDKIASITIAVSGYWE